MRDDNNTDGMTAEELVDLEPGTEVRVEYESTNGERGNSQAFEAEVLDTEESDVQGHLFGTVRLSREGDTLDRRRLKISAGEVELLARRTTINGAVWQRISAYGRGRPTVTLVEDEETEEDLVADGGVALTDMEEGEDLPLTGADLRTELSEGDRLRVTFYHEARGERTFDVEVLDVDHVSRSNGLARVEVEADVLNSTTETVLIESERPDFVSDWSGLTASMAGPTTDATVERLVRLVDEEPDEAEAAEEESTLDRMRRELEEAPEFTREEAGVPAEGERVAVTYESIYADRDKVLTATVETVEEAPGSLNGRLWHVYLVPEDERDERRETYAEGAARPPRRLVIAPEIESVTLETRNGGRWNRLNKAATDPEVEVLGEDEEPEREPIGTVAVKVRHSRCGGTTLLTVASPEEAEDLKGRVLACPHCQGTNEDGEERRHEVGKEFEFEAIRPLASHPNEVDPIDSLEDHEVVEHHASPRRWEVYMEAGVKGRNRAHLAEALGVSDGTVYRHVHDAREAINEVTGQ